MKKKIAFIVALLITLICQIVFAATGVLIRSSSINVRSTASSSSSIIGPLPKDSKVNTLGTSNGFYKISYNGKTGYVESSYIKIVTTVQRIPVLMYHKLTTISAKQDGLVILQSAFSSQMNYLKTHGYNTISLDQFYDNLSKGTALPKKPVLITFDDGYVNNYTLAYPIIKANNQKATVFMISKDIDTNPGSMTSKQLIEMDANGFRVENHTNKHENLATLSYTNQLATITKTKQVLEKLLGRKVVYLAYPYGAYNYNTIKAAKAAGCNLGITTDAGLTSKQDNPYEIKRIFMGPLDNLTSLAHKLKYGN
ncbi:polysaccharide deacetylase family protein [Clostridium estertheticum]|uniref:polysaccharide deacetylase family protein n=1 Tax=Clostridium estertheticum TaxID=238834 RepID=UPI0013E94313|nr:polysaccharide deacetylase family protein [Clostridium estertheticum]MBZ9688310.1 polysaccharide deacetylase family protein [Clostridium estertheticum]